MTDNIAATIKGKREGLHLTQKEFADALGLSKYGDRTIRRWERGETKPTGTELKAVMDFPDTPPYPNNENGRY
ncbi:DNA-binding transcriptional regulator, partial [Escherichia coli]|uniref:helix-turn-helix domain-containing protein n=1 Tax=Escherichia coli TaxID=562 RepID=UPI001C705443